MHCYSVTMAITKFLQSESNRVFQEELIDTEFVDFGEGLVTVFQGIVKYVNIYIHFLWE